MNYIAQLPAILDENGDPAAIDGTPVLTLYRDDEIDVSVTPTLENPSLGIYVFVAEGISVSGDDAIWGSVYIPDATPSTITLPVQGVVRATDQDGNALANPGDQMDLVNAPNPTAVTAIQNGLATSAAQSTAQTSLNTLTTRITSTLFTGITSLASWFGIIVGKTADAGTLAEIQATTAGAGYSNVTASLEALADGSASTSLTITPLSATINSDVLTSYDLTVGQHCVKSWTIAVTDSEGEPVNLSGKTVKVCLWRDSAPQTAVATLTASVSGTDNNNITFSVSATNTATAEMLRFTAQNTTDDQELLEGTITIKARPNVT